VIRTSHCKAQSGLTIVEVLVASVLMMVVIFGLLAIFPQALGRARASGRMLILDQLSSEKLESLRALDYGSTDLVSGLHPAQQSDSKGSGYYPIPGLSEEYSLRWSVQAGPTDQSGNPEPNMKMVTIEATYGVRYTLLGEPIVNQGSVETVFHSYVTD
jgi:hypothetical protein